MEEKVCVKWNDFQENISSSFANIRKDFEFSDVTLACEDGQQLEAHRVILAASSPFFQKLFRRNKHAHPLLYMRDVAFQDLVAIIDFLYCGEANILQADLDSFLSLAEDLKVQGIIDEADSKLESDFFPTENETDSIALQSNLEPKSKKGPSNDCSARTRDTNVDDGQAVFVSEELLEELSKKVKSMTSRSEKRLGNGRQRGSICNLCGKEGAPTSIRDHIEANHLEGISLPCRFCGRKCTSRHALTMHMLRKHKI